MHKFIRCVFGVNHLQLIVFLYSSCNTDSVKTDKFNYRPGRITFFRFSCEIDSVYNNPFICHKNSTFSSVSAFPNTSIISPPGFLIPSALPANASKRLRGVRVAWMPSLEARWLLELASELVFLMLIMMQHISTSNPVTTMIRTI